MIDKFRCEIGGVVVDGNLVGVDTYEFGKQFPLKDSVAFSVHIGHSHVIEKFDEFYKKFIERESEEECAREELAGVYLELEKAGYPNLIQMLAGHYLLLSDVILKVLPSEFVGLMFGDLNSLREKKIHAADISGRQC